MWENIYKGLRDYFKRKKQHPAIPAAPGSRSASSSSLKTDSEVAPQDGPTDSAERPSGAEPAEKNPWPDWVHAYLQYRFNLYDRTGKQSEFNM